MSSNVMCNDCWLSMQNCHDKSICCEMEEYDGDECDWFEPMHIAHGHWVDDGKFKYKHGGTGHEAKELFGTEWRTMERRKCSVCYKVSLVDDSILYGYCPHCGARMDEVTE